ncbi:type II toxin-antitoxin system ParD family antitoxin [Methylobacterium flocculans]|uniref:type II toxin-antitoxin system ParD family antitoxin n=1 Tax=Methylobacterium flocculans TaxID=2984843 RepID=UPI0021F2CE8D|nr:type II toxin-antitoxin system ParD family antitoxin [Methylobacterium sp. FF17]
MCVDRRIDRPGSANLGARLESDVTTLVQSGRYPSRSEVLRESARLVEERERRLLALAAAIAHGLADADAGRVEAVADIAERLTANYQARAESDVS